MKEYMTIRMKPTLAVYHTLKEKVTFLYRKLKLFTHEKTNGRTLALPIIETITLAMYKQTQNIATKKAIWNDFAPRCSYNTGGQHESARAPCPVCLDDHSSHEPQTRSFCQTH